MTNKEINSVVHIASVFTYATDSINVAREATNNLLFHIPLQVISDDARKEIMKFHEFLNDLLFNCTTYKIERYIEENSEEIFK